MTKKSKCNFRFSETMCDIYSDSPDTPRLQPNSVPYLNHSDFSDEDYLLVQYIGKDARDRNDFAILETSLSSYKMHTNRFHLDDGKVYELYSTYYVKKYNKENLNSEDSSVAEKQDKNNKYIITFNKKHTEKQPFIFNDYSFKENDKVLSQYIGKDESNKKKFVILDYCIEENKELTYDTYFIEDENEYEENKIYIITFTQVWMPEIIFCKKQCDNSQLSPDKNLDKTKTCLHSPLKDSKEQGDIPAVAAVKKNYDCYKGRIYITNAQILRHVSEALETPITKLIKEIKIYDTISNLKECTDLDNNILVKIAENIETTINNIVSIFFAPWGHIRNAVNMLSILLSGAADEIEGKDASRESLIDAVNAVNSTAQYIASSLPKNELKGLPANKRDDYIKSSVHDVKINLNKNKLKTEHKKTSEIDKISLKKDESNFSFFLKKEKGKDIEVEVRHNSLVDKDSNYVMNYVGGHWTSSFRLNDEIESVLRSALAVWEYKKPWNFFYRLNKSPKLYGNGVVFFSEGKSYVFFMGEMIEVSEVSFSEDGYKYLAFNKKSSLIYKNNSWDIEPFSSGAVSWDLFTEVDAFGDKLVSKDISHSDVSPMINDMSTQFDNHSNEYLKIGDRYYQLKIDESASPYIEGKHSVMFLKKKEGKFYPAGRALNNRYCVYSEKLKVNPSEIDEKTFYFDSSIVEEIKDKFNFRNENAVKNIREYQNSNKIDGAIQADGDDYFIYGNENHVIKVKDNQDYSYDLTPHNNINNGSVVGNEELPTITVYKVPNGDTYYLIPENTEHDIISYNPRNKHCKLKRQPPPYSCSFYESRKFTRLLKEKESVNIPPESIESLQNDLGSSAFYKDKNAEGVFYYKSANGRYFHARNKVYGSSPDDSVNAIPVTFSIYGSMKNSSEIDMNHIITDVCLIKNFQDKKIILTTKEEAHQTVFGADVKSVVNFYKWVENSRYNEDFGAKEFKELKEKLLKVNTLDKSYLDGLIKRNGKKILIKRTDVNTQIDDFIKKGAFTSESLSRNEIRPMNTMSNVELYISPAYHETMGSIESALRKIKTLREEVKLKLKYKMEMRNLNAVNLLVDLLEDRLKMFANVLSGQSGDNIIFLKRKPHITESPQEKYNGFAIDNIDGITFSCDPYDRIFINLSGNTIKEMYTMSTGDSEDLRKHIKKTIMHELAHATGEITDYAYIYESKKNPNEDIYIAVHKLKEEISKKESLTKYTQFFYRLSLYFKNNPAYSKYHKMNLSDPNNLPLLFEHDDYLKTLIVVNHPDITYYLVDLITSLSGVSN